MDYTKIGLFLQSLRKEKGITQNELADYFGISNKTVSKWECGDALPEIPLLKVLAEYYNVTVDEILNGERNPNLQESNKKDNKRNINLGMLISLSFNFLMFMIGISVGFGSNNGLAAGIIGLIGSAISIILFLVLTYVFNHDYFNQIEHNKKNLLYVVGINLFVLIISVIITSLCDKNTMLTFSYLFSIILRTFSIYGFIIILVHHIICSENKKDKNFILLTVFLSGMILLNIYLNFVHIFQYIYTIKLTNVRLLSKYSFYDNLGDSSSFSFLYIPILLTTSTIVISYFVVSKKITDLSLYILGFITLISVLLSQIYIGIIAPSIPYAYVNESRLYISSFITYLFMVLYLILVCVKYYNEHKIYVYKILRTIPLFIFVVISIVLPFIFNPYLDIEEYEEIGITELYLGSYLGIALICVHIFLLILMIYTLILYFVKNRSLVFSYIVHFTNIIVFFGYLYYYYMRHNLKYEDSLDNVELEDMIPITYFILIIVLIFYHLIFFVIKRYIKGQKEKEIE